MMEDDRPRPIPAPLTPGADLSRLSVEEIEERIAAFRAEIARLEATLTAKRASRSAADSIFKL
ncbi:DUF1192 domain-containing protein [Aquabacter spiritensis]|uniref:Uncharacterized small protein (DUF1192 family) n=1 Tax=Aquabacter spiritensis TaxID=933073 RepID=A0A4R3LWZ5_9HYPH|nr:DUF1192 domain-containing protein [Aquabacter spiritensis]TCT05132.1 uncharacterized small protein (DUF1192 family) [Aquabacter spiritensis]